MAKYQEFDVMMIAALQMQTREAEVMDLMPPSMRDRLGETLAIQYIPEVDLIAEHHLHSFYMGPGEIIRCRHKYGDGTGCPMTTVAHNTLPSWEVRVYPRKGSVFDASREADRPGPDDRG